MKCLRCKTETPNPKFCCQSCAASHNNRGVRRHGNSPVLRKCAACPSWTINPKFCSLVCSHKASLKEGQNQFRKGLIQSSTALRRHMNLRYGNRCMNPNCAWDFDKLSVVCQVDHRDGNWKNNKPSNLRLLCPNCHTRTKTYGSKNLGNGRTKRREWDRKVAALHASTPERI